MSSIFQHCYDLMKSSNDQRQATVKKYDERVQLIKMSKYIGNTHFHYVVYNYDCKLYVGVYINCKSNDAGEVQWSIVMNPSYTHVRNYKSTLDMWSNVKLSNNRHESLLEDCINQMLLNPTEISINREDYATNPLLLEQQLRQVVKRTYGNRWYDESVSASIKKYNGIVSQYGLVESRAKTSRDILKSGANGYMRFYHDNRIYHLHHLLCIYNDDICMRSYHELYLEEMEQEDINTSIRSLF